MQKNEASSKYQYALEKMRDEELKTQQAHDAEKSQNAELQLHKVMYNSHFMMPLLSTELLNLNNVLVQFIFPTGCLCGVP